MAKATEVKSIYGPVVPIPVPKPIVRTVGELSGALAAYPQDLPLDSGFGESLSLTWFNLGHDSECLGIREVDEDEET